LLLALLQRIDPVSRRFKLNGSKTWLLISMRQQFFRCSSFDFQLSDFRRRFIVAACSPEFLTSENGGTALTPSMREILDGHWSLCATQRIGVLWDFYFY